jgi:uncharacterized protein
MSLSTAESLTVSIPDTHLTPPAAPSPLDAGLEAKLEARLSPLHRHLRLGLERQHEADVIGQGLTLFHVENWDSLHNILRGLLKLSGLYRLGVRNALDIRLTQNTVWLPHLPPEFDGFTLLHLSDLHLDMHPQLLDRIMTLIAPLSFDTALITGDFRAQTHGPFDATLAAAERLRPLLGDSLYAILGNHDSIRMVPALEAMGYRLLLNESVELTRGSDQIYLAGVDDPHYFRADNLEKAALSIPRHATSILLSHSPELYRNAAHAGFDLMLAGHTHGGQICLPGGIPIFCNMRGPRRYCRGAWQFEQMQGYTSVGSGFSVVEVRYFSRGEITLHTLRRGQPRR